MAKKEKNLSVKKFVIKHEIKFKEYKKCVKASRLEKEILF